MPLPTEKQKPSLSLETFKAALYGPPKIGKTTLAAGLDPDHTLFIATEPGHAGIEAYVEACPSWEKFREIGGELAKGNHPFRLVVVDTVDELQRMCADYVVGQLARRAGKNPDTEYVHASDFDYGKGWEAITTEFKLRVARLATLGLGVLFISHAKEGTKKDRVGREITTFSADIGQKGSRTWLLGFVDYILFATSETTEQGEVRQLRTRPTESFEAGSRGVSLPDPLPLDAGALTKALAEAAKQLRSAAAAPTEKPEAEEAKEAKAA